MRRLLIFKFMLCSDRVLVLVQAFPDEFHIHTLPTLLEGIELLLPQVDVKSLAVNLMTRIADCARNATIDSSSSAAASGAGGSSGSLIPASVDAFNTLRAFCDRMCKVCSLRESCVTIPRIV